MSGFLDNERFRKLLNIRPEKAIEILYHKYYNPLVVLANNLVHDRKAAEDIVQDVFIHLWEQHAKLGQPDSRSIEHYLMRVVRNKAITYYNRLSRRRRWRIATSYGNRQWELPVEARWINLEINREIRNVILAFPRREKQCLMMKVDQEYTTQQIAERLKVTTKAVERSLTCAYKRLRKYLKEMGYAVSMGRQRTKSPSSSGTGMERNG
ncbi:MAG TPA: sigma-70 family RNA polymerase sigma factor [Cyclobacteriaceae bacterium]|jgi:RNA polymerase sigma-70 factor (ECF subfamily)|nr:MAG: hypothetical protein DIU61_19320 [Bacteroidota bacterium]